MTEPEKPKSLLAYFAEAIVLVVGCTVVGVGLVFWFGGFGKSRDDSPYVGAHHVYGNGTWCSNFDVRPNLRAEDPTCRVLVCEGPDGQPLPPVVLFCRGGDSAWKR